MQHCKVAKYGLIIIIWIDLSNNIFHKGLKEIYTYCPQTQRSTLSTLVYQCLGKLFDHWVLTSYGKSAWKTRKFLFCVCVTCYEYFRLVYFIHLCLSHKNANFVDLSCWSFTTEHESIFVRFSYHVWIPVYMIVPTIEPYWTIGFETPAVGDVTIMRWRVFLQSATNNVTAE